MITSPVSPEAELSPTRSGTSDRLTFLRFRSSQYKDDSVCIPCTCAALLPVKPDAMVIVPTIPSHILCTSSGSAEQNRSSPDRTIDDVTLTKAIGTTTDDVPVKQSHDTLAPRGS